MSLLDAHGRPLTAAAKPITIHQPGEVIDLRNRKQRRAQEALGRKVRRRWVPFIFKAWTPHHPHYWHKRQMKAEQRCKCDIMRRASAAIEQRQYSRHIQIVNEMHPIDRDGYLKHHEG